MLAWQIFLSIQDKFIPTPNVSDLHSYCIVFFLNLKLKFCHAGLGTLSTTTTGQLLQQAASPQQQQRGYSSSSKNSVATRLEHLDLESCDSVTEAGVKFILGRETLENTLKSIKQKNQPTALNFKGTFHCILCITKAKKGKILLIIRFFSSSQIRSRK